MWKLELSDKYERCYKMYVKKHPRELKAVLSNLDVVKLLEEETPTLSAAIRLHPH